ncbi:MAG: pilus assembly protein N-terminal domain-containing protein [Planctomycetota bacterium]
MKTLATLIGIATMTSASLAAQESPASATPRVITLHPGDHQTLRFDSDVQLLVPPDEGIVQYKPIDQANWILIGKEIGTTALTAELSDGALTSLVVRVVRDITLLQEALLIIDPSIEATIARDRDAVLLRGEVQDLTDYQRAERTAIGFLGSRSSRVEPNSSDEDSDAPRGEVQVLNLLSVRETVLTLEDRLLAEFATLGANEITVRRVLRGSLPDDDADLFVLEGGAPDQITLVRALEVAGRLVSARASEDSDVEVLADESGGLLNARGGNQQGGQGGGQQGGGGGGGFGGGFGFSGGGFGSGNLQSNLQSQPGRASIVQSGDGRVLSFIEVGDLPQVRVAIRVYEVDRAALLTYGGDFGSLVGDVDVGNLAAPGLADGLLGTAGTAVGAGNDLDVLNALGFIQGIGFSEELQLAGSRFAIDLAFQALETAGLAKSLSSPNLAMLSGEIARFSVGGQIPIAQTFTPAFGGDAGGAGTFSSVAFQQFGVQLSVRPRVGLKDRLTLDLSASLIEPDLGLTSIVQDTVGSSAGTTAFSSRILQTSSGLNSGEALLVGGLVSQSTNRDESKTPLLGDIPLIGEFFRSEANNESETELFVVLSPVIVRDPIPEASLWAQPAAMELLRAF